MTDRKDCCRLYDLLIKIYLFFYLAGCHLLGWGQEANYFRFQKIEGLSQNTVFKISQDSQGFLWAGTGDGLNRYDGIGFKVYEPSPFNVEGKTSSTSLLPPQSVILNQNLKLRRLIEKLTHIKERISR